LDILILDHVKHVGYVKLLICFTVTMATHLNCPRKIFWWYNAPGKFNISFGI
jgi:hypothetical protein